MIKNIVFDLGGVLLPIDEEKTWKAFETLGAKKELKFQDEIFNTYERGETSSAEFLTQIQPFFFRKIFPADIAKAYNELIYTAIPDENIQFLKRLKKDYHIMLLSNTNALHVQAIKDLSGPFTYKQFVSQFEEHYYSFEMGQRKPEVEIFETILGHHDLKPEETFYIDDSKQHIEAAKTLGIKTWVFDPSSDKITDLDKALSEIHS